MDTSVVVAVIAAASSMFCGVLVWRSSRKATAVQADATDINARAAELAWVKEIRQDAKDAREDVEALQEQVRSLSRQLAVVTREAEHWIAQYQFVHRTAWRPGITLEQLRQILGPDAPQATSNGRM